MEWAKGDNYAKTRSASKYTVSNDESRWGPTPPAYAQAMEPHWNEIRSLLLDSASQFLCVRPPAYDVKNKNGFFYKEVMQIKNIGDSLTDEQKHIAKFWDDYFIAGNNRAVGSKDFVTMDFNTLYTTQLLVSRQFIYET
jgi:hypothetical protein